MLRTSLHDKTIVLLICDFIFTLQTLLLSFTFSPVCFYFNFLFISFALLHFLRFSFYEDPTNERTQERTNKRTNERTNERRNKRTNERTNERTKERTNKRTNKRTNERTNERSNRQLKLKLASIKFFQAKPPPTLPPPSQACRRLGWFIF